MCFTVHPKYPDVKVAKRDIVCYKYGHSDGIVFISFCRDFAYEFGKVYSQRKRRWPCGFVSSSRSPSYIEEGFHSFSNKKAIAGLFVGTKVKCIIPKGAKYFYNPDAKEYVSNQIIIKEII